MNPQNLKLAGELTSVPYISLAAHSLSSFEKEIRVLLSHRALPDEPWEALSLRLLLHTIAQMDTNNFQGKTGVGEREARIFSPLVQERSFFMGHGIGRSGDINAVQPKAVGSSLILKLTEYLAADAIKIMGVQFSKKTLVLPVATGLSLMMVLLMLAKRRPNAKYVLWPRIDQKTCLKAIVSANLIAVPIEGIVVGDEIQTNLALIQEKIEGLGAENVLAIVSTTSCFAVRVPDDVQGIGVIAKKHDVFHVVNNAYGLQCSKICFALNQAAAHGRVDAVVQSTDKNFMVPVGGTVVFSPEKSIIKDLAEIYPGRGSAAPILDLFITLLSMGRKGLQTLLEERRENAEYMREK